MRLLPFLSARPKRNDKDARSEYARRLDDAMGLVEYQPSPTNLRRVLELLRAPAPAWAYLPQLLGPEILETTELLNCGVEPRAEALSACSAALRIRWQSARDASM